MSFLLGARGQVEGVDRGGAVAKMGVGGAGPALRVPV